MLGCYLVTEAFEGLLAAENGNDAAAAAGKLSEGTLLSLLDPLRRAYGPNAVGAPIYVGHGMNHLDVDFGYGSYGYLEDRVRLH